MPLYADNEASSRIFNRFDYSIGRKSNRPQIASRCLDGLMVIAVDLDFRPAGEAGDQAVFIQADMVPGGRPVILFIVDQRPGNQRGNVLHQRTTPMNIEALYTEADSQYGQGLSVGVLEEREVCVITLRKKAAEFVVPGGPVVCRIDIGWTARQENAMHTLDIVVHDLAIA